MAIDFGKLKTRKGAEIVLHLEDESDLESLERQYSQRELQDKLRLTVKEHGRTCGDTGKGTKVHVLINNEGGAIGVLNEAEFSKWEKNPEKDWRHRRHSTGGLLGSLLSLMVLSDLLEDLDVQHGPDNNNFTEPTKEQIAKYRDNEVAQAVSHADTDCRLCLKVECFIRHDSFDEALFQKAIDEYQPATK